MNILFLSDNFPPEVNAPAHRTYEHCREWVRQGAKVTVITCAPNFPQGEVYPGYRNRLYQTEMMDGIKVVRVWSYITANEGTFKRILDYVSFALTAFVASLFHRSDIIIATSPQFFTAVGGYLSSIFKRKPWVMEVRDLWPESIKAVGAMEDGPMLSFLERMELFLYRQADRIVVVTDAFREDIVGRGIPARKIHVIKNGVHLENYRPRPRDLELQAKLGLEGKYVVGYLGTHGMSHKLDFILECAADTTYTNVHYLFIGDGAEKEKLLKTKKRLKLDNVTMLDPVPKEEVARYISLTDLALVPLKKSDTFKTVIPSKIFENAAMQKPILLGVEGESKALIESYRAGLCFEPENKADFLEKLGRLVGDFRFYEHCQEGCQRLARDFDRNKLANRLLDILQDTTGMRRKPSDVRPALVENE